MNLSDKIWMVKSSGRLLGPLSISEVVLHLQQHSISVIDEIRPPSDRWLFIREQTMIMSVLKEMGGIADSSFSETTNAGEVTKTKTQTGVGDETITEEISINRSAEKEPAQTYQKVITAREKEVTFAASESQKISESYGASFDPKFHQKMEAKKRTQRYVFMASISAFIIIVAIAFSYEIKKQKDQITFYTKSLNQAREMIQFGQYQRALDVYDKVYSFNAELFSTQDALQYAMLLTKIANRLGSAEAVVAKVQKPENIIDWRLWMMSKLNISIAKESWDEARLILNDLKQALPKDLEVILAMAQAEYFAGRFEQAFRVLDSNATLFKSSKRQMDEAALLMAQIALASPKSNYRTTAFNKAIEWLQLPSVGFDPKHFYKRVMLTSLQLELNPETAKRTVESLWNANIFEQDKFIVSLTSVIKGYNAEALLPVCIDLSRVIGTWENSSAVINYKDHASGLESACRYFAGMTSEAHRNLAIVRKQRPNSALLAAIEANLLMSDDRVAEAKARISLCGNLPFCVLAQVRECFDRQDDKCLSSMLEQVNPTWLGPYFNLVSAEISKKRGNDFSHRDQILKGLQHYPDYQPLLVRRP